MPKITETIHSLAEAFDILEQLEDAEWRESNGIGELEVEFFKEECYKKIEECSEGAKEYIEIKLREINLLKSFLPWMEEEMKRLKELKESRENKIEKGKERISYLLQQAKIEKMNTEFNKLSFRSSESVEILDEDKIPEQFRKIKTEIKPDKTAIKEAIKAGKTVPWATIVEKQNLQIK